ncbi:MAG: hypothetical protein H6594_01555 [Flavobacteriales bacterium]|nr:hypothetical protein [Flavobacteriales bacterium]
MQGRPSMLIVFGVILVLLGTRLEYSELRGGAAIQVTRWDALGYYQYLPAVVLYRDIARQDWLEGIDSTYHLSGGSIYQVFDLPNGNRATKYFCGIAIMQLPFFVVGHVIAGWTGHPQDGFSIPYQWAIGISPIVYCILALFLWRQVLLRYFSDGVVALTIVLVVLATNAIQYISVDNAQTHGYLFALYALVLWATVRWHEKPGRGRAALIGATVGLATVARPTEAIMLFIPFFWGIHDKSTARAKWALLRKHPDHVAFAVGSAFLAFLPMLIYWKVVTGSWVFDVGSKWEFLDPHWRVLFGGEKGWFIYTPVTVLFVAGLFFMKSRPWKRSVLVYVLLNIWIVIAWHDWRYGGSYSTRALVQSYPVLALPFAALLERALRTRWRWPMLALCGYLLFVNAFQIYQYNHDAILHYDRMNFRYYRAIYLNAHPTAEERALMDPER